MATGRTHPKHMRLYVGGYDLSGETRSIGPLSWDSDFADDSALTWGVQGGLLGIPTISTGQINTIFRFDTTAADSPHDWLSGLQGGFTPIMIPVGIRAAPVAGDPCWMAVHYVRNVSHSPDQPLVSVTMDFSPTFYGSASGTELDFAFPWGTVVHPSGAETAANTATGQDAGAATTAGAWMICQFLGYSGTGSATVTLQHASTNSDGSFSAVTGMTTGAIAHTSMPSAVFAQSSISATINRYTRWQLSLSTLTSVTFALSFARGR